MKSCIRGSPGTFSIGASPGAPASSPSASRSFSGRSPAASPLFVEDLLQILIVGVVAFKNSFDAVTMLFYCSLAASPLYAKDLLKMLNVPAEALPNGRRREASGRCPS